VAAGDVSVVIPSLSGDVRAVLESVARQSVPPAEVEVVRAVQPSGKARNHGVARTTGEVIVFVDDDAVLAGDDTLANLVAPLDDATIGVVGASKLLPPGASRFQRQVARQVARIEHPVVDRLTESNPPVGRHGYTDVTTTCCAIRREVFERCGGFDEELVRGVDSEFFYRLRQAGYRLLLVPHTWTYHSPPDSLMGVMAKHLWYGVGFAQEVGRHAELAGRRYLSTPAHAATYLLVRTAFLPAHAVATYDHGAGRWRASWRPLGALASYATAIGYVYGWYRYRCGISAPTAG
jgi:hypothetical protein